MTKEQVLNNLNLIERNISTLKKIISRTDKKFISRKDILETCSSVAKIWFEQIEPALKNNFEIDKDIINKYHENFTVLLKIGLSSTSRKETIIKASDKIMEDLKKEIIVPVIKKSTAVGNVSSLYSILEHVSKEESDYLKEAIDCANQGFFRASVVLGWAAAISRIHAVIARDIGIEKFNEATKKMNDIKTGRYKRYSSPYNLQSANELRTVFDSHLLWVLEYLQLIDLNQHDRLEVNFTIRNNSAHSGDAPVKEPNVIAFFTDLDEMIFLNPKFKIN